MDFIKKIDHLNLLKIGLAISIFSVGYLMTMFYFQMHNLKETKEKIILYSAEAYDLLNLELHFERNNAQLKKQLLKDKSSAELYKFLDIKPIDSLIKINPLLVSDLKFIANYNSIKTSVGAFLNYRNQIISRIKKYNEDEFNLLFKNISRDLQHQSHYLENEIRNQNRADGRMTDHAITSGFLIALISLVIFMLSYVKMNEDIFELRKINDEIIFMNECLNSAEVVAGFGSWKLNTVDQKLIVSENFYRLLGVEPKEMELTLPEIMSFIHPDDRQEVVDVHQDSYDTRAQITSVYRILLRDGTIKHILSVGKFLENSKGELIKIGVNQDITDLIIKTQKLEQSNTQLIAINAELESFNNIVSHDLQEPLRKIQMFISRIENEDYLDIASESTIGYFDKIKFAAKRMQNLMTDLVDYTRTIKGDRIFEKINLNSIFEEIKEELSFTIEETNAVLTVESLPEIFGIRFQIQQLLINLISNSLKYVDANVSPIIKVNNEKFEFDIVQDSVISSTNFYKISISDNGIGFEQHYAEKIFLLFKRLETNQTYKGTGLGLAICKKIIENHSGYITAKSQIGKGSVFTLYLSKNNLKS